MHSLKTRRLLALSAAGLLAVAGLTTGALVSAGSKAAGPPVGASAETAQAPANTGMKAYLDDEGNFVPPPEVPKAIAPVEDISHKLTMTKRPDGLIEMNLNGELMSKTTATLGPDGTIQYECCVGGAGSPGHQAHGTSSVFTTTTRGSE